jgi:hypothetical protein
MIKNTYGIDIDSRVAMNSVDAVLTSTYQMPWYARDQFVLCFTVKRRTGAEWAAVDLTALVENCRLGLKKQKALAGTYLAFSDIDQFNLSGDWTDGAQANLAAGQISIRVDLNTASIAALFAADANWASQDCLADLEAIDSDGKVTTLAQLKISLKPDVVRGNEAAPGSGQPNLLTLAAGDARYVPLLGDGYRWKWSGGELYAWFVAESKWRKVLPIISGGQPTLGFGDPED